MTNKKQDPSDFFLATSTELKLRLDRAKIQAVDFARDHIVGGEDVKVIEDVPALIERLDPSGEKGLRTMLLGEVDAIERQLAGGPSKRP